jgi:hypothetical protein
MDPLWSPVVATSGNQRQTDARRSGENKPKPLPWVATGCLRRSMVRRGSPVRVRKRALFAGVFRNVVDPLHKRANVMRTWLANALQSGRFVRWASTGRSPCKQALSVVSMGENATPSLQRGGQLALPLWARFVPLNAIVCCPSLATASQAAHRLPAKPVVLVWETDASLARNRPRNPVGDSRVSKSRSRGQRARRAGPH